MKKIGTETPLTAVIFDRDGTLIEHIPYLSNPEEVRLLEGVVDGLRMLRERGISLFVHTNQSGVGRGYFDLEAVNRCNKRMVDLIDLEEGVFDGICIAPEHPKDEPDYRKPSPRYASEIAKQLGVEPKGLCYVGDRASDLITAKGAGTRGIGMRTGRGDIDKELEEAELTGVFPVVDRFEEAAELLLHWNR